LKARGEGIWANSLVGKMKEKDNLNDVGEKGR
jgi:hypothetical protein